MVTIDEVKVSHCLFPPAACAAVRRAGAVHVGPVDGTANGLLLSAPPSRVGPGGRVTAPSLVEATPAGLARAGRSSSVSSVRVDTARR
ncbi:MAG TPA: hypothetical protein VF406_13280 [Thermodesulfobacteriota bacterium]